MTSLTIDKMIAPRVSLREASEERRRENLLAISENKEDVEKVGKSLEELAQEAAMGSKMGKEAVRIDDHFNKSPFL